MLEELSMLVRLQGIDTHLMDLEAEKGDLPELIKALNREIVRFSKIVDDTDKVIKEITLQRKQFDQEIEGSKDRLKKSQNTLFSVKTTREYDAISSEIEQAKHTIVDCERKLVELLNREEEAGKTVEQARAKLLTLDVELKEKQADMQERMESSQGEELRLQHEREKLVMRLKKPVFSHYERIRKIRDGIGVAQVDNGACTYCFAMIPPQRQTEVKRMDDLILCEVCGCILVSVEEKTI